MAYRYRSYGFGSGLTPTVRALLVANVAVHFAQMFLRAPARIGFLDAFGLVPAAAVSQAHVWQFLTYMFLHGGLLHLLFNMFALWMFGGEIESLWGRRRFLEYYLICGLGGGLTYTLTAWGSTTPLVGASGAIFGILLAYGLLFPDRQILLYFIIPIKARWFVVLFGALELLAAWQGAGGNIGHFAHLGGMLFGYLYLKAGLQRGGLDAAWRRRRARSRLRVLESERPVPPRPEATEVDRILEKISRQGLTSLTEQEKDVLRSAGRRH